MNPQYKEEAKEKQNNTKQNKTKQKNPKQNKTKTFMNHFQKGFAKFNYRYGGLLVAQHITIN